jgi:hypothetical protein
MVFKGVRGLMLFFQTRLQIFTMSNVDKLHSLVRYTQGILSNYIPSTLPPLIFLTLALHVVKHYH